MIWKFQIGFQYHAHFSLLELELLHFFCYNIVFFMTFISFSWIFFMSPKSEKSFYFHFYSNKNHNIFWGYNLIWHHFNSKEGWRTLKQGRGGWKKRMMRTMLKLEYSKRKKVFRANECQSTFFFLIWGNTNDLKFNYNRKILLLFFFK